ncbi:MAG: hypothetical protein HQ523_13835 [Lentisphaerae bacterium]|nr:hypothetical protein [Lentisphaerota bacterium]
MTEYRNLIKSFLERGYETAFFSQSPPETGALILRHDIDFDVGYAHQLSLVEDELGVHSTYFFLLTSRSYNLLEDKAREQIESIKSRGHRISLHFDPTIYSDVEHGAIKEKGIFENVFDTELDYISIHRPSEFYLNNPDAIAGMNHTYQPKYFEQVNYFADSQGKFRYGHPADSEPFRNMGTIQLLIHPIWWVTESSDVLSKLHEFLDYRIAQFQQHMSLNCKPYREYLEERS